MEEPFAKAEEIVSRYFRERKHDPEHGTIEIFGERYVLVRAASLSVEFFGLVHNLYGAGREAEADEFARNILFDLAHSIGKSDARNFHAKMGLSDPIAKLSAGPVHFAHTGWALVSISEESRPSPDQDFCLVYEHPYSFESDAWLRADRPRNTPACIMNAGYSSGWCEESFGMVLVATEVLCRARGDDRCRFLMAPPNRIEGYLGQYRAGGTTAGREVRAYQIPDFFSRKRVEEELRWAKGDLERRVAERTAELKREMAERAEVEMKLAQTQKLEAVGRLAGGIAHDFNNLMAIVMGNCALLARRLEGDPSARHYLDGILAAGGRATGLTQQLLAFSRGQARHRETLDLNSIVTAMGSLLARLIGEDVELVQKLAGGGAHVEADRGQIEQIIMNLAVNARDAMPGGGRITIETAVVELGPGGAAGLPAGRYARLTVADTGIGMDKGTAARIFDPFFTTKDLGKGTGLGLATVYGIVRQSGGDITVESAPGRGSRFQIDLPSVAPPVPALTPDAAPTPGAAVPSRGGSETILVVEDLAPLRRVVAEVLHELGYEVLEAGDPDEALRQAGLFARRIDLLLTDVVMPHMSGIELARRLVIQRPETKVLYMSGYATDLPEGGAGAEDLLCKPFTPEELAARIRERLDRA